MDSKRRILTLDDMKPREEYLAARQQYTDAQAHQLGYPSAEVLRLSDELTTLAGKWRATKDDALVVQYHKTLYEMILKGYDVDTLPVQDQLPADLMPELPPAPVRAAITQAYQDLSAE